MKAELQKFAMWVIIVLLMLALFTLFQNPSQRMTVPEISYSQLLNEVDQGRVRDVVFQVNRIHGTYTDGRRFQTNAPVDPTLVQRMYGKGVAITAMPAAPATEDVQWVSLLTSWLPFVGLIAVWIFLSRWMRPAGQFQGPAGQVQVSRNEIDGLKRQIADMQAQLDRMGNKDKG
jgi:cell division protease FtsH